MNNADTELYTQEPKHFWLSAIHKATRQSALHLEDCLGDLGVSAPDAHILSFVRLYGPSSVGELVRVFGYRKPTMSSMLNRLESRGLLGRQLNPADRRSLLVELTAKGNRLADAARKTAEQFDSEVVERVSVEDLRGFQRVIEAIAKVTGVIVRQESDQESDQGAAKQQGTSEE